MDLDLQLVPLLLPPHTSVDKHDDILAAAARHPVLADRMDRTFCFFSSSWLSFLGLAPAAAGWALSAAITASPPPPPSAFPVFTGSTLIKSDLVLSLPFSLALGGVLPLLPPLVAAPPRAKNP